MKNENLKISIIYSCSLNLFFTLFLIFKIHSLLSCGLHLSSGASCGDGNRNQFLTENDTLPVVRKARAPVLFQVAPLTAT